METPIVAKSPLERELERAVQEASHGTCELARAWLEGERLVLAWRSGSGRMVVVQIEHARSGRRAYRTFGGLGFSYRGQMGAEERQQLDAILPQLHAVLSKHAFDPARDPLHSPAGGQAPFPTPRHLWELDTCPGLAPDVVESFRRDGHVLIRRVLSRELVAAAVPAALAAVRRAWPPRPVPLHQRPDAYSRSFTQLNDLAREDPVLWVLVRSRRLASCAAQLMGVERVRLFCEDWLIKEANAPVTPWHQDEAVYPFEAESTVTCWLPLVEVDERSGGLRFMRGSHRDGVFPVENISDVSEAAFEDLRAARGWPVDVREPMELGDVSFHHGRLVHGALPNVTERDRPALVLHCFADGARLTEPRTPTQRRIFDFACPGMEPGQPARSAEWPLLLPVTACPRALAPLSEDPRRLHVRGCVLPEGVECDLWILDGRLVAGPLSDAVTLEPTTRFVVPGLVDMHSHISYPHDPDMPVATASWLEDRRRDYAYTGVLLTRDMGATSDVTCALPDVPGLARVHGCGNMVLPFGEFPFTRTPAGQLVEAFLSRARAGARWVKVFVDWTDDFGGRRNSGFSGTDEIAYPGEELARAVRAAHDRGLRVAGHCFTREGAAEAVRVGVDTLEHGWGVDLDLLRAMAERGIAWVPLVGIARSMWQQAREHREEDRVRWIEDRMHALAELVPAAVDMGVEILAGTDWFPHVTVVDELRELVALGMSTDRALAAATWRARRYLGEPGLVEGAPADMLLLAGDPRLDLGELERPLRILASGRPLVSSQAHVRPEYAAWRGRREEA